jgi:hypothetical protein
MGSKPPVFRSALGRISSSPQPPRPDDTGTRPVVRPCQIEETTPVRCPYRVIDGKIVDMGAALPSDPPPTARETPLAKLPPQPILNVTWVESRGTRIRNAISFFLLACFIVIGIAGATWAFLWNGKHHQELIQHQQEEQEKEDRYR